MIIENSLSIDQKKSTLITLLFCFTPVVWIASTITMDYLFAELLLLLAWYLLGSTKHKYISGLFLGLAIGARPSNIIFVVPMMVGLFLIELKNNSSYARIAKNLGLYLIIFSIVTSLVMMPVFIKYGFISLIPLSSGVFSNNQSC